MIYLHRPVNKQLLTHLANYFEGLQCSTDRRLHCSTKLALHSTLESSYCNGDPVISTNPLLQTTDGRSNWQATATSYRPTNPTRDGLLLCNCEKIFAEHVGVAKEQPPPASSVVPDVNRAAQLVNVTPALQTQGGGEKCFYDQRKILWSEWSTIILS